MYASAANSASGWVSSSTFEFISVSAIWMSGPCGPAYWSISWRNWASSPASCAGSLSAVAASPPLGYQCTMTKSIEDPASESTVWFQSSVSPEPSTPSGQLPGRVSTAPSSMLGSTAFIALEYCRKLSAYVVGLLLLWLSASQPFP